MAGPIFSKYLCSFEAEIKMADEDEIFRNFRPKLRNGCLNCFSLEYEIFKSTTNDGEPASAVETPSMSEIRTRRFYFRTNIKQYSQEKEV